MTRPAIATIALLLCAPLLAGCLGGEEAPAEAAPVAAASAEDAGAVAGPAPVAPKDAYVVASEDDAQEAIAYPVPVRTNAARAPVTLDLSGQFTPTDCRPLNFGPLEQQLAAAIAPFRVHPLHEHFQTGDVFSYRIEMTYTNAPDNWAEIHPHYGIGSTVQHHEEATQEMTEVVINWTGQGFRASEDDMAWIFVNCPIAAMRTPIPYTLTFTATFAEGAVPAEAPMLLPVPAEATKLFVRGVPIDPEQGVLSHFRLFDGKDELLCECALGSSQETAVIELPEDVGDLVLLVDHTDNGFVSVAFDAPPAGEVRALGSQWVETLLYSADGGAVDTLVEIDLAKVPLHMFAHVRQKDAAGAGKHTQLTLTNARGEVLRASWGGHLAWSDPVGGDAWLGFWPGDWEYVVDHHAYAPGAHTALVQAEALRGDLYLITREYVR